MLLQLFFKTLSLTKGLQEGFWQWWYQSLASKYKVSDWRFMNYGYEPTQESSNLVLKEEDKKNRLFIQLYFHVLDGINLKRKQVLEVGSGRGGGADYVARYFHPASITGLDFSQNAIDLAHSFYNIPHLHFTVGNAESLPFNDNSFDVVYNIESSHCYPDMPAFVSEVFRVLKPGGTFAWADLRKPEKMKEDAETFLKKGFILLSKENITENVIKALETNSDEKQMLIKEKVPYLYRYIFSQFAGLKDTQVFNSLKNGQMVYWHYRLQKPEHTATEDLL